MRERSETLLSTKTFSIGLVSLVDIFLFKSVAGRPDDVGDMATLVQTDLDFETIKAEIAAQTDLLGGERFITIISGSLEQLEEQEGIQTPLDDTVRESYTRHMNGLELRMALGEETAKSVRELVEELGLSKAEVERRFEYLKQYGAAERTDEGLRDTGHRDEFTKS